MKILVSGASGLVGSALVPDLEKKGHEVYRLVRRLPKANERKIFWDPDCEEIEQEALEGFDAVIHLGGESIAEGRWTAAKKARIRESRVQSTDFLSRTLAALSRPPKTFACASATGFFGNRGDEELTENSPPGEGFLAEVCREWEAATAPAEEKGVRVLHLRFGVILSEKGGAFTKMLPPFKLGIGGKLGDGKQYVSWIALTDVVRAISYLLEKTEMVGAVNLVSPDPVTNEEWTRTLGEVLHRPTFFRMPAFAAKIAFGEMAEEALLASVKVVPQKLQESGFQFEHPELKETFESLLSS